MTQLSKLTTLFFIQFLGNIYLDNLKIAHEFMSKSFFNQYFLHINPFFITILHTTQGFFLLSALLRDCLNLPIGYYQVVRLPLAMLWAQRSDSLPWHNSSVRCRIIFNFFIACIEPIEIKTWHDCCLEQICTKRERQMSSVFINSLECKGAQQQENCGAHYESCSAAFFYGQIKKNVKPKSKAGQKEDDQEH